MFPVLIGDISLQNVRIAGGNIPVEGKFLLQGDMKIFFLLLLGEEITEFLININGFTRCCLWKVIL